MALTEEEESRFRDWLASQEPDEPEEETDDEGQEEETDDDQDEGEPEDDGGSMLVLTGKRADSFLDKFLGVKPAAPAKKAPAKKAAPPAGKRAPAKKAPAKKAAPAQDPPPPRQKFF